MKKLQRLSKIVACLFLLLPLAGCWDQTELEERSYVIAIGIDKSNKENQLDITFLIANAEVGSQQEGGSSSEPAKEVLTITANDFITARNSANAVVARAITYDLLRMLIVSEEMAQDKTFIRWIYDATKDREIRRDVLLAVCPEKASTYLQNNKPKFETRPHKYFQFMTNRGIETGLIPESDLQRFYTITELDADLFLAMYTTTTNNPKQGGFEDEYLAGEIDTKGTTNETQFMGSAVFKEGRMIGKLNGEDTRLALILDETAYIKDVLTTYPDPFDKRFRIATRLIRKQENKVDINLQQGRAKVKIKIPLTIEVLSNPSMVDYAKDETKKRKLKKHLENELEEKTQKFVDMTQSELKGSPFSLSLHARKLFPTISEYKKFDWMKSYPDADIDIEVSVKLGEFGKQTKVPNLNEMRD